MNIVIDEKTLKEIRALAIALQELMREMEKQKEDAFPSKNFP